MYTTRLYIFCFLINQRDYSGPLCLPGSSVLAGILISDWSEDQLFDNKILLFDNKLIVYSSRTHGWPKSWGEEVGIKAPRTWE